MNYTKHKKNYAFKLARNNYKLARTIGLKRPIDGYTMEEMRLEKILAFTTIDALYAKLPTARLKCIVALHFELNYPQDLVAAIFGVSQATITDEIALIKRILMGNPYKPRKCQVTLPQEEIDKVLQILSLT